MGRPQFLEEWIDGATICRGSSTVGFVWSLYEGCLNFFAKLVPLVSERRSTASANKILNEEVGRLLSWGDGFDNGELDRTLERDLELKSTTLEYLSSLGTLLTNSKRLLPIILLTVLTIAELFVVPIYSLSSPMRERLLMTLRMIQVISSQILAPSLQIKEGSWMKSLQISNSTTSV
jgi:hypothetical protein